MNNQLSKVNCTQSTVTKKTKCDTRSGSKNITVILPAYNEEDSIGSIVLLTRLYSDKVIVVDDASSDRTAEIVKNAGAEVIVHQTNRGRDIALDTGFKAAINLGADEL
jgi:glycosyltransferase involved in cell wall biosynthesis